jgi:non-specific serine/threonine protein kinase
VLPACPGVRVLATSREPLRVAGEVSWRAPSLPAPLPDEAPSLAAVARYPAVALFLARACGARPDFAPGELSAPALAQRRRWPSCAGGWTASRWRWSWRRRA